MEPERPGPAPRERRLGRLWELLFPSRCLGCERRGVLLCAICRPLLPWLPAAVCPRCAVRSLDGRLCRRCQPGAARPLGSVRAACSFEGAIRTAIHRLKFRHARYLASFLAEVLAESLASRPIEADLLLPVPLSPKRRRERGFNQSELVAVRLAKLVALPGPSPELLSKPKETPPQVGLTGAERRRNVRDAFICPRPDQIMGRRCLVIDDVMSTGATLEACAAPLLQAGADRVMALVIAKSSGVQL